MDQTETTIYYADGEIFKGSWIKAPHWINHLKILHREDGPTIESPLGEWWFKNNKLHRIGAPAVNIKYSYNKEYETHTSREEYWIEGKLSNKIGPAILEIISDDYDGSRIEHLWAIEGKIYINEVEDLREVEIESCDASGFLDYEIYDKKKKFSTYIDYEDGYIIDNGSIRDKGDSERRIKEGLERLAFVISQLVQYFKDSNISDEDLIIWTLDKKYYVRAAATKYLGEKK